MVFFTCNHCGESLQKPRVEKHYAFVCRTQKFLTCVDCLKDFRGEEYAIHIKCITEEERYSAKGSLLNGVVKKGEVKQESWVEMIASILDKEPNMKPAHHNLLNTILGYSNIPRKKPKFMNFIRSSSGGRVNMKEVEEVWNIIEKYKDNQAKENGQKNTNKSNDNTFPDHGDVHDATTKRKVDNEGDTDSPKKKKNMVSPDEDSILREEKFSFQDKIIGVLECKKTISLKKLEKKVIKAYLNYYGKTEVTPKISKKFNKKLKKIPNVEITEDQVVYKGIEA
ncbi:unnamed protein product [Phaedon cochleariae]|uniref:Cell growth-regulating nucleolar protein n=1 Tax=Phaedon cochleariae TaxID=80249 RepID=A0A9P0GQU3_PHACE|nr:unnamed protein product [Phaedon cochleariae]